MESGPQSLGISLSTSLAPYTSWKVGGEAQYFAQPTDIKEIRDLVNWAESKSLPLTVLSGGSNVLISDSGIKGLVLHLGRLSGTTVKEDGGYLKVSAWAGTPKSDLVKIFMKRKLAPAIFLAGLPGDVGGGVVMNAGLGDSLVPREFVEIIEWVEVFNLKDKTLKVFKRDELKWSYRHCEGWKPGIITQAGFVWPLKEIPDLVEKVFEGNRSRIQRQPLNLPSCGSVFKNPNGDKAGRLIEQAGLKGFRIGDAQVSEKHANFIVNLGKAKASEVRQLIDHVRTEVRNKFNIELETEVVFLGF